MAIKDLNDLNHKQTGLKLHADDWNYVVNALKNHIETLDIHLPITIDENNNALIYKEGSNIYAYALTRKTGEFWGQPYISNIKVNNGNPDEIPSIGIKNAIITFDIKQEHNGETETIDEFELIYTDFEGVNHTLLNQNSFTIDIPFNNLYDVSTKKDIIISIVSITANEKVTEDTTISLKQEIVEELSITINTTQMSINWTGYTGNLGQAANSTLQANSSSFSIPVTRNFSNGQSQPGTPITTGGVKTFSFTSASGVTGVSINQINGTITRSVSNDTTSAISLGTANLNIKVYDDNNSFICEEDKSVTVELNGITIYPVYAGFISRNTQTLNDSTPGILPYNTGSYTITNSEAGSYFAILEQNSNLNNPSLATINDEMSDTYTFSDYAISNLNTTINGILYYASVIITQNGFGVNTTVNFTIN